MKCLLSPLLHTTNRPCNIQGVLPTLSFSILHTWTEILDSAFVCWPMFDQINHAWYDEIAQSAFGARILFQRRTGTYWYILRKHSKLHLLTLHPPSGAYESQQNAWLGPVSQFSSAWRSPPQSDHPGEAFHGQSSTARC